MLAFASALLVERWEHRRADALVSLLFLPPPFFFSSSLFPATAEMAARVRGTHSASPSGDTVSIAAGTTALPCTFSFSPFFFHNNLRSGHLHSPPPVTMGAFPLYDTHRLYTETCIFALPFFFPFFFLPRYGKELIWIGHELHLLAPVIETLVVASEAPLLSLLLSFPSSSDNSTRPWQFPPGRMSR